MKNILKLSQHISTLNKILDSNIKFSWSVPFNYEPGINLNDIDSAHIYVNLTINLYDKSTKQIEQKILSELIYSNTISSIIDNVFISKILLNNYRKLSFDIIRKRKSDIENIFTSYLLGKRILC